ncbi:amidase [Telmatospirillum sp. J64-1]|uniref:amidase n=1 Tax=Telmatospirillum sp. J64-1 TaxID=2502183 RepID=UPI00115E8D1F|nr:amidase [Telmatospirillum sp. J64-1]
MNDPLNAFCPGAQPSLMGRPGGPLSGLSFGAKDLFDVEGWITGAGNPDWARTHAPAEHTASAVSALLAAGATLVGKTQTDELAYSLNGENAHYGTPVNPQAPERIPGGSSSGSASAVAGALVDTALGTDTGGSIRIPASYCGIFGMRPSHGVIPADGLVPLAPSFDTIGWFARDASILRKVGEALLPSGRGGVPVKRILLAEDAFALLDAPVRDALIPALARFPLEDSVIVAPEGLAEWLPVFRILQGWEIWQTHGAWIRATDPAFGPGIRERFDWASTITGEQVAAAQAKRADIRARMEALVPPGTVLCLPSAPGPAPFLRTPPAELEAFRNRALSLTCIAGLSGLPQISLPGVKVEGCPIGLSLIGARGSDLSLLACVERHSLPQPATEQ